MSGDQSYPRPNRLRELRLSRGLTLHEVATEAGTTPTQVARLEKGTRPLTRVWEQRLARAMGVDPRDIYVQTTDQDYWSKLIPDKEQILKKFDGSGERRDAFDKDFLLTCFEIAASWGDLNKKSELTTPRFLFTQAIALHDVFVDLYLKIGRTEELLAAMRQQFVLTSLAFVNDAKPKRRLFGGVKSIDDTLTFFKEAVRPVEEDITEDQSASDEVD